MAMNQRNNYGSTVNAGPIRSKANVIY